MDSLRRFKRSDHDTVSDALQRSVPRQCTGSVADSTGLGGTVDLLGVGLGMASPYLVISVFPSAREVDS
jgi:hypothetical protein